MAVGFPLKTTYANGDVYSASDVNDTNGTVNLLTSAQYAAGKNVILNSDFRIWQRGTSFSLITGQEIYTADRNICFANGTISTTASRQTFTAGTAPVAGYEGTFFHRTVVTSQTSGTFVGQYQKIEDVRTYAGQTVTLSFWAKADASRSLSVYISQNFGSGGSGTVSSATASLSVTTSWQRFTYTVTLPSIAGKTIGTGSSLIPVISFPINTAQTIDIWGEQLESGSTATAFQTATGTIQGELAACQRYYFRTSADASNNYAGYCNGYAESSTTAYGWLNLPVPMRTTPSSLDYSNIAFEKFGGTGYTASNCQLLGARLSTQCIGINLTISGATAGNVGHIRSAVSTTGYLGFSAEL